MCLGQKLAEESELGRCELNDEAPVHPQLHAQPQLHNLVLVWPLLTLIQLQITNTTLKKPSVLHAACVFGVHHRGRYKALLHLAEDDQHLYGRAYLPCMYSKNHRQNLTYIHTHMHTHKYIHTCTQTYIVHMCI